MNPQIATISTAIQTALGLDSSNTTNCASWHDAPPPIFDVAQFADRNPAFTQAALRNLIFKAAERHSSKGVIPGNGLIEAGAIIRQGRKVLLHETRFFAWLDGSQQAAS